MILNRLEIKNIASLKGDHQLDFKSMLHRENLFAITGPTGSGKSSILSSISLALYGKHYKDKLSPLELISLGTSGGSTTLFYSYNGAEYKSLWEGVLRKNNGELLKTPKIQRTTYVLENNEWVLTPKKSEDIINLTFEQFCKTIILNQGEFHKFLTSDFKERKEILEKLTEDTQLVEMGKLLNKDILELEHLIEIKNSEIKGIDSLPKEEYEILKTTISNEKDRLAKYKSEVTLIEANFKIYRDLVSNLKERKTNTERKKTLEISLTDKQKIFNDFKVDFDVIQKKLKIAEEDFKRLEPEYIKAENSQKKIQSIEEQLQIHKSLQKNKSERNFELTGLEQKYQSDLKELHKKKKELLTETKGEFAEGLALEKLEVLHKKYLDGNHQEKILITETNLTEKELSRKKEELDLIQKELKEINKDNEKNKENSKEIFLKFNLDEEGLRQKQKVIDQEISKKNQLQKELIKKNNDKLDFENKLKKAHQEANLVVISLYEEEKKFKTTQDKLKIYELAAHINACQEASLENHSCVVCGNEFKQLPENPFIEKAIQDDLLEEKNKQNDLLLKIENLKNEKNKLNLTLSHLEEEIKSLRKYTLAELGNYSLVTINELEELIKKQEKEKEIIEENLKFFQQLREKTNLLEAKTENILKNQNAHQQQISQLEQLCHESRTKADLIRQQNLDYLKEIHLLIPASIHKNLTPDALELFIRLSRESDKINREAKHIDLSLTSILNEKLKLQVELSEVQSIILSKEKDISHELEIIKSITLGKNPSTLLKALKDDLQVHQNQIKIWQTKEKEHLSGISDYEGRLKMANEQIDDLAVLIKKNSSFFLDSSTKIIADKFTFFDIDPSYLRLIEIISSKLSPELSADQLDVDNFSFFYNEAEKAFLLIKEVILTQDQNIIISNTKLELYEKNALRSTELYKEISTLSEKLSRKKNLYQVMGKDEFRTYLLSMVERQLLILANNELKSLCGERYVLIQSSRKNTITPEFSVLDRFSGGMKRNILTLSGGETFMLSLALALGLAEMTRGQAEINCFFIDEGFGTLDADSIDEVLNVLLAMKDQGKQIGIISHIKALTDRIGVNVRLMKNSTGSSRLDYFYND